MAPSPALLEVEDLEVGFPSPDGFVRVVRGLGFTVDAGETVALVGESGCGKSVTARAIMGLAGNAARVSGTVKLQGADLLNISTGELRRLRGAGIGMVFQDPMTHLNPAMTVEGHLREALAQRRELNDWRVRAVELLEEVGIPEPAARMKTFPHQLSGGLKQRVLIATAIAANPSLIIADEPTTALDVTTQAQIIDMLDDLCKRHGTGLLLITHDLGLVAQHGDRMVVMYGGQAMEEGRVEDVFAAPLHPYTKGLFDALPDPSMPGAKLNPIPGNVPRPAQLPTGCPFRDRCSLAGSGCDAEDIPLAERGPGHNVRCIKV